MSDVSPPRKTVLFVDDNLSLATCYRHALRSEGFDSTGDKVIEFDSAVLVKVE